MGTGRFGVLAAGAVALALLSSVTSASGAPLPAATPHAATPAPAGSGYVPVAPQRLLDTRTSGGPISAHNSVTAAISTAEVPAGATAVVVNVTGTDATAATYLSVRPLTAYPATSSNLNLAAGETRANLVTVELDTTFYGRGVDVRAGNAALDAIVDLEGYYIPQGGSGFTSLPPTRVLDTRANGGALSAGQTMVLDVSGSVPAGATTAVFNLTAVQPTADTYVTAWADGSPKPGTSNLNAMAGRITPNLVTVAISPDRKVDLYNLSSSVNLVADLAGYYSTGSAQLFYSLNPFRALDTRDASGNPLTPLGPKGSRTLDLSGWLPAGASSVVANLTGTNVTAGTFLTAYPADQPRPVASNLNLTTAQTAANLAVVQVSGGRAITLYNLNGDADVVIDVFGYFAPQLTGCTANCAYSWGSNMDGRLGNGTSSDNFLPPAAVYGLTGVTAVSGYDYRGGYALRSDGTVWAWGADDVGQLGDGMSGHATDPAGSTEYYSPVPVRVGGLTGIVAISGSYALRSDGTVWAWGPNNLWQLGNGSTDDTGFALVPVQVSGLTGVTAISTIRGNGYALRSDGTVWSWGQNGAGQLGNGTSGTNCGGAPDGPDCASAVPVQVSGLTGVTHLGPGYATKSDGTVWRWGPRDTGHQDNAPVQMSGLTDVTQFAQVAGGTVYALRTDGTVWSWGYCFPGTYGDGEPCDRPSYRDTPVQATGVVATAIGTDGSDGYALKSDGTISIWGSNSAVPVALSGISGVTAIGDFGYAVVS